MRYIFLHHLNPLADRDKHPELTVAEFDYNRARANVKQGDQKSIQRLDRARDNYRAEYEKHLENQPPC
jgi:hypothetical protein